MRQRRSAATSEKGAVLIGAANAVGLHDDRATRPHCLIRRHRAGPPRDLGTWEEEDVLRHPFTGDRYLLTRQRTSGPAHGGCRAASQPFWSSTPEWPKTSQGAIQAGDVNLRPIWVVRFVCTSDPGTGIACPQRTRLLSSEISPRKNARPARCQVLLSSAFGVKGSVAPFPAAPDWPRSVRRQAHCFGRTCFAESWRILAKAFLTWSRSTRP